MKHLCIIVSFLLAISGVAYAQHGDEAEEKEKAQPEISCPQTRISDNSKCMDCHVMLIDKGKAKFGLQEIPLESSFSGKPYDLDIVEDGGVLSGYYFLTRIDPSDFRAISHYMYTRPEIKKFIVEIHSPGGNVLNAWRIVGILEEMRSRGIEIETRCYGMALSAGAILLIAGDQGSRFVNAHAEIMLHKIWQFAVFEIADPDSSEDKTNTLKHFQANINAFISERTKITAEEMNDKTFKRNWWISGKEALVHGVADWLIGGKIFYR
jgi:ATP-dependent protease ClpP protease subunit